ncbi:MAG: prepilin-type N-terminal cleavage/methylation domain-containing protein, partial [Gammaproteobacteria bacterium]|nr:prepilin-type N-terminal cleavage/methylation domain-containing protein [Gammaproteobacteria bacterium]
KDPRERSEKARSRCDLISDGTGTIFCHVVAPLDKEGITVQRGFTIVELLVVVMIIGV